MKITVFVPAKKRGEQGELLLTKEVIGDFEINEPKYSELKQLELIANKRFISDISIDPKTKKPILNSLKINQEGFIEFYGKVLEASGLSEDDIVKYGFANADIALEQIYLAWTKDEKKQ